jgi:membrane associated rhomboid family serine protease
MQDSRYPMVTLGIMGACFVVFLLQIAFPWLTSLIAITPSQAVEGMYWQFVTYMFAHGSITHLGLNMLALFIFGSVMERILGRKRYITLYLVSGVGSAGFHILLTGISDIPMLGASGAVFAVLTAYAFKFPRNIIFIFPGIPLPAALLVVFFAAFEFLSGIFGFEPGIANFGHLGGILIGILMMYYWKRADRQGKGIGDFEWVWEGW